MMQIRSTGMVSTHGRGMEALETALLNEWRAPSCAALSAQRPPMPAFWVPDEALKDREVLKNMRRADRLSKMSVIAAYDAWKESGLDNLPPSRIGVLLATGLGPHVRTFRFLDGILDYGESSASPTDFSHSVHNAAAGYITTCLQTRGPVQTMTDFNFAFQHALRLAQCWLAEGRCDAVLAGAAEELGEVMLYVCDRMLDVPQDGIPQPFAFSCSPRPVPGEGAVFFVLTRPDETSKGALVAFCREPECRADLTILDAGGLSGPENEYLQKANNASLTANYTPAFGSMMTGSAFQCAIAARMIEKGVCYPNPLLNNEHDDLNLLGPRSDMKFGRVHCLKRAKDGRWLTIKLHGRGTCAS